MSNVFPLPPLQPFDQKSKESQLNGRRRSTPSTSSQLWGQPPLIDNWSISFRGGVIGTVSKHPDPDIEDGDEITTSALSTKKTECREGLIVETLSGSKYRLGYPKGEQPRTKSTPKSPFRFLQSKPKASESATGPKPSGKTIGDGKYVLVGRPRKSSSGRSQIWTAYRATDPNFNGPPLTVKISSSIEALERENFNYNRVTSGLFQGRFVEKYDYFPEAGPDFVNQGAIVIESGTNDLKETLAATGEQGLVGRGLRDAAASLVQCTQAMHSSGLVWTDIKAENFVVVVRNTEKDGKDGGKDGVPGVKGIDLESAIKNKNNPIDFSPEACPPEFAKAFIKGEGEDFVLEYSYDMWSLGMVLYELSTGKSYFKGMTPAKITRMLQEEGFQADVSAIEDNSLRDLVKKLLDNRPRRRPNIYQVLLHPYFTTTGVGPFGF